MTLQERLKAYLDNSGESMRALSLRAGLNAKSVSDILRIPGIKPKRSTLTALSTATGIDFNASSGTGSVTYATLLKALGTQGNATAVSRVKWLLRKTGWIAELEPICRLAVIEFFASNRPARFGLSPGSYRTYKSEILTTIDGHAGRNRKRNVSDIGGVWADVHKAITDEKNNLPQNYGFIAGAFLTFLHDRGVNPSDITTDDLAAYYAHRLETGPRTETKCRKHVMDILSMLRKLADHPALEGFAFPTVDSPFEDLRDKFGVDDALLQPLLAEFDQSVAPWAQGLASRTGQTRAAFIAGLDALSVPVSGKKAAIRAAQKARADRSGQEEQNLSDGAAQAEALAAAGFLVEGQKWSESTLQTRRGYIVSLAKAIIAECDVVPDSMAELTDFDFLQLGATVLHDSNAGSFSSDYVASVLTTCRKIARQYLCADPEQIEKINQLIEQKRTHRKGIAGRNRAKLRLFTPDRIQTTIDLSDLIITDVNSAIDEARRKVRKKTGRLPKSLSVVTVEMARDIAAAVAHSIMLKRAPRSANLIGCRLDWIAYQEDGTARIIVPAAAVKGRRRGDADLTIPLSAASSALLRDYIEKIRPLLLQAGDDDNPFLFPGQGTKLGVPYGNILGRLTGILHEKTGVQMHAHLYRHLIGWIWLKESLDNLPRVSKLLGHKTLQTTIDYYADIDEEVVLDEWQKRLNAKNGDPRGKVA